MIKFRKSLQLLLVSFLTLLLVYGCSQIENWFEKEIKFPTVRAEIKIGGDAQKLDYSKAKIYTFAESKQLQPQGTKIRIPKNDKPLAIAIRGEIDGKVRLIDYYISNTHEQPELSFESTAKSLIIMHPLFANLTIQERSEIFKSISQEKTFPDLVKVLSTSGSILESNVIDTATKVALGYAASHSYKIDIPPRSKEPKPTTSATASPDSPNSSSNSNSFDSVKFPLAVCGDPLPSDPKLYPVNLYPVYIEYSNQNLAQVRSQFCQDALDVNREKNNKKSIQVASFVNPQRANNFKEFLKKKFGNAEVGEPTKIPAKISSSIVQPQNNSKQISQNNWLELLNPSASAQTAPLGVSRLEYTMSKQFGNDGRISSPSLLSFIHKVQLRADKDNPRVSGTSIVAQKILVVPSSKVQGKKIVNPQDIVAEYFIEPIQLGTFDGKTIGAFVQTSSNQDKFNEPLKLSQGKIWQDGEYTVFLSGGISKNSPQSPFHTNLALFLGDSLGLIYQNEYDLKKVAARLAELGLSCKNENVLEAYECLTEPENLKKLGELFGVDDESINSGLKEMLKFQGDSVKKLLGSLDLFGKVTSISRILFMGVYYNNFLSSDSTEYIAKFNVREFVDPLLQKINSYSGDVSGFSDFEIDCTRNSSTKYIDLEFQNCGRLPPLGGQYLKYKNFSNRWYEVIYNQFDSGKNIVVTDLIPPGSESDLPISFSDRTIASESTFGLPLPETPPLYDRLSIKIRQLSGLPSRKIIILCNEKPIKVWRIWIAPKCNSEGTYINLKSQPASYPVIVNVGNQSIPYDRSFGGASGTVTSSGSGAEFTMSVR
jgi:hypothetical protein